MNIRPSRGTAVNLASPSIPEIRPVSQEPISCRGDARARVRPARPWHSQGTPELCPSTCAAERTSPLPSTPITAPIPRLALPRPATRLLIVMFAADDVCQRSLDTLAAEGFRRNNVPPTLHADRGRSGIKAARHSAYPEYLPPAAFGEGGRTMIRPLSRRREIEAAIAAHNSADRETLLPPSAARLLAVMFPRGQRVPTQAVGP